MEVRVQRRSPQNPIQSNALIKNNLDILHNIRKIPSDQTPLRYARTEATPLKNAPTTTEPDKKFTFFKQQTNENVIKQVQNRERPFSAVIKSPLQLAQQMKERIQKQKSETQRQSSPINDSNLKTKYLTQLQSKKNYQGNALKQLEVLTDKRYRNYLENNASKEEKQTSKIFPRAKSAQINQQRERNQSGTPHKQYQQLIQIQNQASEQFKNLTQLRLQRFNKQLNEVTKTANQTCQLQLQMKPQPPPFQDKGQRQVPHPPQRQMKIKEVQLDINKIDSCSPVIQSVRPATQGNSKPNKGQAEKKIFVNNFQVRLNTNDEQRRSPSQDIKRQMQRKLTEHNEVNNDVSDFKQFLNSSILKSASKLDEYIIGKTIGQGAYAVVKYAIHKPTNRSVAIKIYDKYKLLDPTKRKNVKREIEIMSKLQHPNIAQLIEAIDSQKQVFLVQEYCKGINLHQLVKKQNNRKLPEFQARLIFRQIVSGISYCHDQNISHRDIKLENILIDETSNLVKIIDFGFSTLINKKLRIFCGTPSYMAPEIVNKKEFFGQPADVWALGVLLFAILCGTYPFRGSTDAELYKKISKSQYNFPETINKSARDLIFKMLQVDPLKRPLASDILKNEWVQDHQNSTSINQSQQQSQNVKIQPQPPSRP